MKEFLKVFQLIFFYFSIDLESDTKSIFIFTYQMALAYLNEPKEHFHDLLSKDFIRPSIFSLDAPVLFVKKKSLKDVHRLHTIEPSND